MIIYDDFIESHKYFIDYKHMQYSRTIRVDIYISVAIHIFVTLDGIPARSGMKDCSLWCSERRSNNINNISYIPRPASGTCRM